MTEPSEYYIKKDFGNVVKKYGGRKGIYSDNGQLLLEDGTYPNTVYVDGSNDGWVKVSELEEMLDATIILNSDLPPIELRPRGFAIAGIEYFYTELVEDNRPDEYRRRALRLLVAAKAIEQHEASRNAAHEAEEAEKRAQIAKIKQALIHEGGIQTLGAGEIADKLYEAGIRPVD